MREKFLTIIYRCDLENFFSLILLNANNNGRTVRTTICIRVNYDLLIKPAVSDDSARSCTAHETYSDLFKVVGILLRDQLTRQKC